MSQTASDKYSLEKLINVDKTVAPSPANGNRNRGAVAVARRRSSSAVIDRKAVNAPRFLKYGNDNPGPGAHDPLLTYTRNSSWAFSFCNDDRKRYLGRPENPEKIVKRKNIAENGLEEEQLAHGGDDVVPAPGAYNRRDEQFKSQTLTNEFTFGKTCKGGLFPGIARDVSMPVRQQPATSVFIETASKFIEAEKRKEAKEPFENQVGNSVGAKKLTPGDSQQMKEGGAVPPSGGASSNASASVGEKKTPRDDGKSGKVPGKSPRQLGKLPRTPRTNEKSPRSPPKAEDDYDDSPPRGMHKEVEATSVKWSGVCTGPKSPRKEEAPVSRPTSSYQPRPESPLEQIRRMPWDKQVEHWEKKIKEEGPLPLPEHRMLTHLVSNPTIKSHKMTVEKETMKRMQERKMGINSNQKELLGVYQYHWPTFQPERS